MLQYGILIGYTIIISYFFWRCFSEYGSVNRFFIYITDTEQKQIQPCCTSTGQRAPRQRPPGQRPPPPGQRPPRQSPPRTETPRQRPPGHRPPEQRPPSSTPWTETPLTVKSGRYASYWNAFLFSSIFIIFFFHYVRLNIGLNVFGTDGNPKKCSRHHISLYLLLLHLQVDYTFE